MGLSAQDQTVPEYAEGRVSIRDLQLFQLNLVREFMRICDLHGLRYWAACGTLLGAVRHKGFIPWDDDVDLWMPPSDYLRFREVCKESLGEDYYLQVHSENPCNFIRWQRIGVKRSTSLLKSHADIHAEWGVCIDIFPLAACPPPGTPGFERYMKKLDKFSKLTKKYIYKHDAANLTGLAKAYHLLMASGSDERNIKEWLKIERELLGCESFERSPYCLDVMDGQTLYQREWFDETTLLPFEGLSLPAPSGYKNVLVALYGEDWMELPPEEKRVCHSGGGSDDVIIFLSEPYAKYLK